MRFPVIVFVLVLSVFVSCNSVNYHGSRGAIVLGDSTTIVKEVDSQYLRDFVADIHLKQPEPVQEDTATAPPKDSTQQATTSNPTAQPTTGSGLNIEFKELKVFIPGIATRSFGKKPVNDNGASFQITGGQLNGNQIKITGAAIQKISQRYQTSVVLKDNGITAVLQSLNYTSDWETLKGGGAAYIISGLDAKQLKYTNANAGQISAALKNAIHGKRYSRKKEKEILDDLSGIKSVTEAPLKVALRTVIWQIEGKDKDGKPFKKEIRLDMII